MGPESHDDRRRLAFVVRLWLEPGAARQWRGVVESLDDHRRRYFTDVGDVADVLRQYVAAREDRA